LQFHCRWSRANNLGESSRGSDSSEGTVAVQNILSFSLQFFRGPPEPIRLTRETAGKTLMASSFVLSLTRKSIGCLADARRRSFLTRRHPVRPGPTAGLALPIRTNFQNGDFAKTETSFQRQNHPGRSLSSWLRCW